MTIPNLGMEKMEVVYHMIEAKKSLMKKQRKERKIKNLKR
jgi:hypothetical protein